MTLQSPAGPFGIAEPGSFSMAAVTHCVCFIAGASGMPGMFILIDTSQLPSRMGDALCAMAVHERPRVSRATELKRIFIGNSLLETLYWKLSEFTTATRRRGRRSNLRAPPSRGEYRHDRRRHKVPTAPEHFH